MTDHLKNVPVDVVVKHVLPHTNPESQKHLLKVSKRCNDLVIGYAKTRRDSVHKQLLGRGQPTFAQLLYHIQMHLKPLNPRPDIDTVTLLNKIENIVQDSPYTNQESLRQVLSAVYNKLPIGPKVHGLRWSLIIESDQPVQQWRDLPTVGSLVYSINRTSPDKILVYCITEGPNGVGDIGYIESDELYRHDGWHTPAEIPKLVRALNAADITATDPELCSATKKILWMALTRQYCPFDKNGDTKKVAIYDICC
jgi:hypothetical protein